MNKKNIIWFAGILAVIVLIILVGVHLKRSNMVFGSSIGVACIAHDYYERDGFGYLTIEMLPILDESKPTLTSTFIVENEALRKQLSEIDLGSVIGAHIFFNIPHDIAVENHLITEDSYEGFDLIELKMSTDKFDSYFRIEEISVQ